MARKICIALSIFVAFILQTTIFQYCSIGNISPNLLIILTSAYGFMYDKKKGLLMGFLCGLLIDIFYGEVLGLYAMIYSVAGYLNGSFKKMFFPEDLKFPFIAVGLTDIGINFVIYILRFLLRGQLAFPYYLLHIILPEMVYTLIVMIGIYPLFLLLNKKLDKIEKRRAAKFV